MPFKMNLKPEVCTILSAENVDPVYSTKLLAAAVKATCECK
jgi:hypothetical protein